MFTGLIRERGVVAETNGAAEGVRLVVSAPETAATTHTGDSVAVDGACLTAVDVRDGTLAFDAVRETLARTTIGDLRAGSPVNLEPALQAGEQLGGHYVQGHVDGVGTVRSREEEGDGARVWIDAPRELLAYVVEKGSIAVQGVSLTVAGIDDDGFAVALIPHTLAVTTLGELNAGDRVNLETDVLAKYVERLLRR